MVVGSSPKGRTSVGRCSKDHLEKESFLRRTCIRYRKCTQEILTKAVTKSGNFYVRLETQENYKEDYIFLEKRWRKLRVVEIESSISFWYSAWLIEQVRNVEKNPTTLNKVNPNPKLPGGGKEFSSSRRTICRFYVYRIWDLVPVCLHVIGFLKIHGKMIFISKKWGIDDIRRRCPYRTLTLTCLRYY